MGWLNWGSDEQVEAFDWAEMDVVDEIDADLPLGFDQARYETKAARANELARGLNPIQRTGWYRGRVADRRSTQ